MSTFVTIATFLQAHEVAIPKARLEAEGILCFVRDEYSMYLHPFFPGDGAGIKLQVAQEEAEKAARILKDSGYESSAGDPPEN
jgi:hypothetical protein